VNRAVAKRLALSVGGERMRSIALLSVLGLVACQGAGSRSQLDCAGCHVQIAGDWQQSAHARSWSSSEFQKRAQGRMAECAPCHAPDLIMSREAGKPPRTRPMARQRGVDCIACHQDARGAMHGPFDAIPSPHPSQQNMARMRSVEFCASCHGQNDRYDQITEWRQSSLKKTGVTCLDCHMPLAEMPLVEGADYGHAPRRQVPRHLFLGPLDPKFLSTSAQLRLKVEKGIVEATIDNGFMPHTLPGGGFSQFWLRVSVRHPSGRVVMQREERLDYDRANRMRAGEVRRYRYPLTDRMKNQMRNPVHGRVRAELLYKRYADADDSTALPALAREMEF